MQLSHDVRGAYAMLLASPRSTSRGAVIVKVRALSDKAASYCSASHALVELALIRWTVRRPFTCRILDFGARQLPRHRARFLARSVVALVLPVRALPAAGPRVVRALFPVQINRGNTTQLLSSAATRPGFRSGRR